MGAALALTGDATGLDLENLPRVVKTTLEAPANGPAYPPSGRYTYDAASAAFLYEEYHPFGTSAYRAVDSTIEVSAKRYRYAAAERDEETGLDHMGLRYYAPWLGRWTSADPIGLGDGVNRYAYVHGNPVSMRDPGGTRTETPSSPVLEEALAEQATRIGDLATATSEHERQAILADIEASSEEIQAEIARLRGEEAAPDGDPTFNEDLNVSDEAFEAQDDGMPFEAGHPTLIDKAIAAKRAFEAETQANIERGKAGGIPAGGSPLDPIIEPIIEHAPEAQGKVGDVLFGRVRAKGPDGGFGIKGKGKGGSEPVKIGKEGEDLAGIDPKKKRRIESLTGTAEFRVPDEVTNDVLREIKNTGRLSVGGRVGKQLKDFAAFAKQEGLDLVIEVRENTKISETAMKQLAELGFSVRRTLPAR